MANIEIKAPQLPESVPDGRIATWYKKAGQAVARDELLVDIETDKVLLEVVAPADGVLQTIVKAEGDTINSNELLAVIEAGATAASAAPATAAKAVAPAVTVDNSNLEVLMSPAARKLIEENKLDPNSVPSTGKDGRITKEDVVNFISGPKATSAKASAGEPAAKPAAAPVPVPQGARAEQRVPMTRLRAKIAERLLEASQTTAMLTTFNEVNMAEVMALRTRYKDMFEKKHGGVRLGFMSFFVRACIEALKRFPAANASIDGNDIVYHGYQDIGVAVSSPRGLVVPVLRSAWPRSRNPSVISVPKPKTANSVLRK